ncbi:MAG: hypothetical protein J0M15_15995 [Deltaproteobacteria bacterium]|nr:hypothetical protein [Deltaproteobacteria bacterium]
MNEQIIKDLKSAERLPGAILLSGDWGSGKTYFWNHSVVPALKGVHPVYLSVFGLSSIRQIKSDLVARNLLANPVGKKLDDSLGSFTKIITGVSKQVASAVGKVAENQIGINPIDLFSKIVPDVDPLEFLPSNLVICIDDLERCSPELIVEILGLISFLTEERQCKVVALSSQEALAKKLTDTPYIEKVFWKTVRFRSDLNEAFDVSIDKYVSKSARKSVASHKKSLLETFRAFDHKNIRTLNQCLRWISDLHELKIELAHEYASYLAALTIIKSTKGRLLSDPKIYSFGNGYHLTEAIEKSKSKNQAAKELSDEDRESLLIYDNFFKNRNNPSSVGLYKMVDSNYIDAEFILNEIDPPSKKTKAYKTTTKLTQQEWLFEDDKRAKTLRADAIKVLKTEKKLGSRYALGIFNGIVKLDQILGRNSDDAKAALEKFIDSTKFDGETLSDLSWDFRTQEERTVLEPYFKELQKRRSEKVKKEIKAEMIQGASKGIKVDIFSGERRFNEALKDLAIDVDVNAAMEKAFFKHPAVHYDFYFYMRTRGKESNWGEVIKKATLKRLKDFKLKNKLDSIQTKRLSYLIQRYEMGDDEIR